MDNILEAVILGGGADEEIEYVLYSWPRLRMCSLIFYNLNIYLKKTHTNRHKTKLKPKMQTEHYYLRNFFWDVWFGELGK